MKSYWMQSDGVNADIALREVDRPVPGPGQMLIRVKAAGLNRGEFILGHGLHKAGTAKQIGMEAAGEIVACGDGVTGFKVGDRVMGRCPGAFAEYALMSEPETMLMPSSLSFSQAASLRLPMVHSYFLLSSLNLVLKLFIQLLQKISPATLTGFNVSILISFSFNFNAALVTGELYYPMPDLPSTQVQIIAQCIPLQDLDPRLS